MATRKNGIIKQHSNSGKKRMLFSSKFFSPSLEPRTKPFPTVLFTNLEPQNQEIFEARKVRRQTDFEALKL